MSDAQWHYTDKKGKQQGPASTAELKELISNGSLSGGSMVWKDGMADWQTVAQIDDLKPKETKSSPPPVDDYIAKKASNPYATPTDPGSLYSIDYEPGGIGRFAFVFSILVLGFLLIFIAVTGTPILATVIGNAQIAALLLGIGFTAFMLWPYGLRLKNTGMNPWAALLTLVPFINIYITLRCLAFPKGYAITKKLDIPGKIISFFYVLLIIIYFAVILLYGGDALKTTIEKASEKIEQRESLKEELLQP